MGTNSLKTTLSTGDSLTQLLKILENHNSADSLMKIESYTQEVSLLRAQVESLQEKVEHDHAEQQEFQANILARVSSLEQQLRSNKCDIQRLSRLVGTSTQAGSTLESTKTRQSQGSTSTTSPVNMDLVRYQK